MRVCDNCLGSESVAAQEVGRSGMGQPAKGIDLCRECLKLLMDADFPRLGLRHKFRPSVTESRVSEVVECSWPGCTYLGEGDMGRYQADRCESHQVDEDGVLVADCYCSTGGGDNMDVDICHHHLRSY